MTTITPEQIAEGNRLKDLGNAAYKAKKFEEAISLYDQAIAANGAELIYHNNKAAVYMEMQEYTKAIELLTAVIDKKYEITTMNREGATFEKVGKVLVRIAQCYAKLNKYEESKEYFDRALTEDNNKNVRNARRDMEAAWEVYKVESYYDPAKSSEARERGNEFFKTQKYAEAKAEYDEAILRNPKDAKLYSNRGATLTKLMAYPDAMRDLDKCIELDPTFVKAYSRKGTIYYFTKEYNKAIKAYEDGLKIDPNNEECRKGIEAVHNKTRSQQFDSSKQPDKEQIERAMNDPEIQAILKDQKIQQVLKQMQEDPNKAKNALMEDPQIAEAFQKLMVSGILQMGPGPKEGQR